MGAADRGFKPLDWNEFNGVDLVFGVLGCDSDWTIYGGADLSLLIEAVGWE